MDHASDADSAARAEQARRAAQTLGVPFVAERRLPEDRGLGVEDAARQERYQFLRRCRERQGASHIVVAHHRDDQLATVVMRLLQGSGLTGFGAMRPAAGDVLRPLLAVARSDLMTLLAEEGLAYASDPANDDLDRPRNLVEQRLVPWLMAQPGVEPELLLATAGRARRATDRVRSRLRRQLKIDGPVDQQSASLDLAALRRLPRPLLAIGLDALRRAAGSRYPASQAAQSELARQLAEGGAIGCDCGDGWAWRSAEDRLQLSRVDRREVPEFSYKLRVPGELSIPELRLIVRISENQIAPWMFRGSKTRAAMALPLSNGQYVSIRNRRPGDRMRPFGCAHQRKLKDVLIDRRVPQAQRDALPLLLVDEQIAWVPGVTIDDTFRLTESEPLETGIQTAWVAEILDMAEKPQQPPERIHPVGP